MAIQRSMWGSFLAALLIAIACMTWSGKAEASAVCYNAQPVLAWDGVTDDSAALTTAINTAITQAGNGAGCVELPAGTGKLCQVTLPAFPNGLTILGTGVGSTLIRPCSTSTSVFVSTTPGQQRNLEMGQFSIIPTNQQTAGRYFDLRRIQGLNLHDIYAQAGWDFAYFEDTFITNVCNTNIRTFDGTVFTVNGGADFRWCSNNNYDDDSLASQVSAYLLVRKGGGIILDAVDAIHCGSCYVFNPLNAGDEITWVFANQTIADTCSGSGWVLNAAAGTRIVGFQGVGIWSASCAGQGISTIGAGAIDGVSLIGPRIQNNGGDGIYLGTGINIEIGDAMISGNSQASPGTAAGVSVGANVKAFGITGGRIGTMMQYGDTQKWNIYLAPTTARNFSIQSVNLCGHAAGGGALYDGSTSSNKMIRNNPCLNAWD